MTFQTLINVNPLPPKGYLYTYFKLTKHFMETSKILLSSLTAGADGKKIVFLFTDLQIKDESFLEDVSMILTTGEVPNLFPADEKAEILERVQNTAREEGRELGETSFANLYNIFMTNVKNNLHIVLAMSPVGSSFRNRLRMFPSLINCCAIDWFTEWPEDALEEGAINFLEVRGHF